MQPIRVAQMMENAGRSLARLARHLLGGSAVGRKVAVMVGKGNNGGGGLVAARHLANAGADIHVMLAAAPDELGTVPSVSMDGRGRALDNIFIERLWRSVKNEDLYLQDYASVPELEDGLGGYFHLYNHVRPHQSLQYRTPAEVHFV